MITGAHSVIYSTHAEADRVFLRDVLNLISPTSMLATDGLIFGF